MSREVNSVKSEGNKLTITNTIYSNQGSVVRSTSTTIDKRTGKPLGK